PHRQHGEYCCRTVPVEQGRWSSDHAAIFGALVLNGALAGEGTRPLEGYRPDNDDNPRPVRIGAANAPPDAGRSFASFACDSDQGSPESRRWTHCGAAAWAQG